MTCNNCAHIHGCKDARVAHVCDSFEYTALLASREALIHIVGENVAINTLRKTKTMSNPEHPNTALIKDLVNTGDIDGLNNLRENLDIQLPFLVMAASQITGDSNKIGSMLRNQKDKRAALIDLLIQCSQELPSSTEGSEADVSAEPAPAPTEDEKPKRTRRKRRTKAEIAADEATTQSESVEVAEPTANLPSIDFDRAFNDILSAISNAQEQQASSFEDALKRAFAQAGSAASTSEQRFEHLADRLDRISSALVALEDQLLLTGMILEPTVRKCFED